MTNPPPSIMSLEPPLLEIMLFCRWKRTQSNCGSNNIRSTDGKSPLENLDPLPRVQPQKFILLNFPIFPGAVAVARFHFGSKHFNVIVITRIAPPSGRTIRPEKEIFRIPCPEPLKRARRYSCTCILYIIHRFTLWWSVRHGVPYDHAPICSPERTQDFFHVGGSS